MIFLYCEKLHRQLIKVSYSSSLSFSLLPGYGLNIPTGFPLSKEVCFSQFELTNQNHQCRNNRLLGRNRSTAWWMKEESEAEV